MAKNKMREFAGTTYVILSETPGVEILDTL